MFFQNIDKQTFTNSNKLPENKSFSIRIQWRSHQSLSEKRGLARTLSEALGDDPDFLFTIANLTPHPLKKGGPFTIVAATLLNLRKIHVHK